jgi:hypothetical protein
VHRRWLGTLLLTPLLLGGCGSSGKATASPTPSGTPWIVVANGSATPSPVPSGPSTTPSAFPTGFLPLPSGTPTATPAPTGGCVRDNKHELNYASVVPGTTSAAVTFWNPGGLDLVQYRVTAISQDLVPGQQRDVGWTVLTPGAGCGYLTATVTGLDPKTHYVFSVDEVTTKLGRDGTRSRTIARSLPVRTA